MQAAASKKDAKGIKEKGRNDDMTTTAIARIYSAYQGGATDLMIAPEAMCCMGYWYSCRNGGQKKDIRENAMRSFAVPF